jgi:SNF2 family DNA or RNA helicase
MLCPYCLNPKFLLTPLTCWKNVFDKYQMSNFFEIEKSLPSLNKRNKISTILNIIDDSKKVLIFSNHNETFAILKRFLDQKSLKYLELKGTKERRDNTIDMYKTGKINIMLLNTIVSGAGLNLQETTDIILYHRLPEFQKIQVLGRANRIGREVELTVHYLE